MKKVAAAFLAGAVLMVGTQAIGASGTLVGKTIEAEYTVKVYGKKLADPAIVINGKSYAPVRAIGELAGYKVSVSGKTISLDEKRTTAAAQENEDIGTSLIGPVLPVMAPDAAMSVTKSRIEVIDGKIDAVVAQILATSSRLKADPDNIELKRSLEHYKDGYAELLKQKELELEK
ncbi:hypothetical protein [Paenibacillus tengchongensis]|uniref:hypothetical protein n=1 Tax=Paenibacillus tengchongensis TaxID=2608684 RepID=UPI00124D1427|nr:hypothetical protein [Paenibacillus tengchongensis]